MASDERERALHTCFRSTFMPRDASFLQARFGVFARPFRVNRSSALTLMTLLLTRLPRSVPVSWRPTAVTARTASEMSRRRCGQEGATPPPSLRRLRSTPPVSLRSVPHVPACRAVRIVPHAPGWRAPSDRSPCHRHARASGIARCRSGSRPRPVRPARAGRHCEGLPPQSCRSRHEESDGALASRLRRPRGMPDRRPLPSAASSAPSADGDGVHLERRRCRRNLYHLSDFAELQTNVGSDGSRRRNQDSADHRCPDARVFCLYGVCAVHHGGYGIVAGRTGSYGLRDLRVRIGDSDRNCGQRSARWVSDRPDDHAKRLRRRDASTT